ncbi:hypothetical protein LWM68_14590 [Niabella sp. W65]|nr:hypothetical protein [Niabella sp. W65]MCH7363870.1 hypothetical protein [Niabella sp. W65]
MTVFYSAGKEGKKFKMVSSYLQEGNDLYVGFLQSGGLVKYTGYNNKSDKNIPHTVLPKVEVGDILKDSKGNIWVSTLNNGVFVFLKNEKQIQKLTYKQQFYPDDIWYIRYKNKILDIGYNQLIVDQLENGHFQKRWIGDTSINFNPVTLFCNYQNKAIIFGTRSIYQQSIPKTAVYKATLGYAYKDHYFHHGGIYLSAPGSFIKFTEKLKYAWGKRQPRKFSSIFSLSDSIFAQGGADGLYINNTPTKIKDRITKVRVYNKDILACTDNGLFIKRAEQYFHITNQVGLLDNQCVQVEYYGDNRYRLLTKNGLAYINAETCKVTDVFNAQSLGQDVIIRQFDVENDSIWLATNKGIYVLDERFIFNKSQEPLTAYLYPEKLNNRNERYTQELFEIKYNKNKQVKMLLEVLDFSPNKYSISYQVEKDNSLITERSAIINNSFVVNTPEPGNYIITAFISRNNNQIDKTLVYTLTITPLWHHTIWARLLFATGIFVILWLTIRWITRYVIKEKEKD